MATKKNQTEEGKVENGEAAAPKAETKPKTTPKKAAAPKVEAPKEASPYVNDAAKEYFERVFPTKYKVAVANTLYKRVSLREGANIPTSYIQQSVKVAPPKTVEYEYVPICRGGEFGKDVLNGADAKNYKAEKAAFLKQVNEAFANHG